MTEQMTDPKLSNSKIRGLVARAIGHGKEQLTFSYSPYGFSSEEFGEQIYATFDIEDNDGFDDEEVEFVLTQVDGNWEVERI